MAGAELDSIKIEGSVPCCCGAKRSVLLMTACCFLSLIATDSTRNYCRSALNRTFVVHFTVISTSSHNCLFNIFFIKTEILCRTFRANFVRNICVSCSACIAASKIYFGTKHSVRSFWFCFELRRTSFCWVFQECRDVGLFINFQTFTSSFHVS